MALLRRHSRRPHLIVAACSGLTWGCMTVLPVPATGKGCAGRAAEFFPARDVVERQAAQDLDCHEPIQILGTDTEFQVVGCARRASYSCEADAVSGCSLEDAVEREGCKRLDLSASAQTGARG